MFLGCYINVSHIRNVVARRGLQILSGIKILMNQLLNPQHVVIQSCGRSYYIWYNSLA